MYWFLLRCPYMAVKAADEDDENEIDVDIQQLKDKEPKHPKKITAEKKIKVGGLTKTHTRTPHTHTHTHTHTPHTHTHTHTSCCHVLVLIRPRLNGWESQAGPVARRSSTRRCS